LKAFQNLITPHPRFIGFYNRRFFQLATETKQNPPSACALKDPTFIPVVIEAEGRAESRAQALGGF